MNRFERQIPVFGQKGQKEILNSSVAVIGCGGLGCNVITQLALAGVGHLIIVDFDTISESDLNRQFVHSGKCGKKTKSMKEWVSKISSESEIIVFDERICRDNTANIIAKADIVVDCTDNNDSRLILNDIILQNNIPMVYGAAEEMFGQITVVIPGKTPCLGCFLGNDTNSSPSVGACVSVIGSLQAMEALKLITGKGNILKGRLLTVNMEKNIFEIVDIKRRKNCAHCQTYFY
ncbi:MAG: HesA/MoeB/ThiF family protein [archaeon]|nr:HesA/MoeB/ThiF family protein [archaeon]